MSSESALPRRGERGRRALPRPRGAEEQEARSPAGCRWCGAGRPALDRQQLAGDAQEVLDRHAEALKDPVGQGHLAVPAARSSQPSSQWERTRYRPGAWRSTSISVAPPGGGSGTKTPVPSRQVRPGRSGARVRGARRRQVLRRDESVPGCRQAEHAHHERAEQEVEVDAAGRDGGAQDLRALVAWFVRRHSGSEGSRAASADCITRPARLPPAQTAAPPAPPAPSAPAPSRPPPPAPPRSPPAPRPATRTAPAAAAR